MACLAFAQIPSAETGTFALTNAKIETVTNGTIENGTLVIADGNILDIRTNVEAAFVQGRRIDLSDRHKKLYYKYDQRIERQAAEQAKK